jgi:hypothetical protein
MVPPRTPIRTLFNAVNSTCGRVCFILPRLNYHEIENGESLFMEYEIAWVAEPTDVVTCCLRFTEFDIDVSDLSKKSWRYTPEKDKKFRKQKVLYLRNDPNWEPPDFKKIYEDLESQELSDEFNMS